MGQRVLCVQQERAKKKKKRLTHIHTLPSVKTSGRSTKTHTHRTCQEETCKYFIFNIIGGVFTSLSHTLTEMSVVSRKEFLCGPQTLVPVAKLSRCVDSLSLTVSS